MKSQVDVDDDRLATGSQRLVRAEVVNEHIAWLRTGEGLDLDALSEARMPGCAGAHTKRLIDVDDGKLAAVRAVLGTQSLKTTVDAALDEVIALDRRRRALLAERGVDLAKLADPAARDAMWG